MSRINYLLVDAKNHRQPCMVGLVDNNGCFVLLLDDDETRHYRFSDESTLIDELFRMNNEQAARLEKLDAKMDNLRTRAERATERAQDYRDDVYNLTNALKAERKDLEALKIVAARIAMMVSENRREDALELLREQGIDVDVIGA